MKRRGIGVVAALALAAPAAAQDDLPPDATDMAALAEQVPPQKWYPADYRDVRIAAEAQIAEAPRDRQTFVGNCATGGGLCFDPVDPLPLRINADESDPAVRRYGDIALSVARLRQNLVAAGFPDAVFARPLAAYERKLVEAAAPDGTVANDIEIAAARELTTAIEADRLKRASELPRMLGYDEAAAVIYAVVVRSVGPSARTYPVGRKLGREEQLVLRPGDRVEIVRAGKVRTLAGPGKFAVGDTGSAMVASPAPRRGPATAAVRGDYRPGIVFQTSPPSGEVLMVSAFAFKLCQRKNADPWDRFKCRWNEIETGVPKPLSGRFVYQVKWPDGTVRKGTREIAPAEDAAVTFKKVGS
ncbi:hypothetical protein [Sphingopyxis sp. KK2]|uniref:hypothetical protein n=1 Tax=Sphingopyxis sp. KK2 TaxID=1855727 RepID=UPI001181C49D|nr:hypothetical protein [Sphingopyxis sp. KK2]